MACFTIFKWLSQCAWPHSRTLMWRIDNMATSELLMLIPVLCCFSMTAAESWWGGTSRVSPPPEGSDCSYIFARGSRVHPRGCNRAAKWNKSLDIGFMGTSVPVWKGRRCKCCGRGGANTFQRFAQLVPLQLCGPGWQKAMVASHFTGTAWCESVRGCVCVCVCECVKMNVCVSGTAAWV